MKKRDISLNVDGTRLNLRAGAIITSLDKVLVCCLPGKDWWFLPGGRVALNESTEEAIVRELEEEVGGDCHVKGPAILSENFFDLEGEPFHELCVYYNVEWSGVELTRQMEDSEETFRWITKQDLCSVNLLPSFLKQSILSVDGTLQHVVSREGR